MRSRPLATAVAVAAVMAVAGCRGEAPKEEVALRAVPTSAPTVSVSASQLSPLDIEGRLDVAIVDHPASKARIMLLVDRSVAASFSIESLKQSLSILLDRLPPDLPIGIRVFPGDDGATSTLLAPVSTGDRTVLKLKVLELAPGGAGSFSRAMLDASADFITEGEGSRVILVAPPTKETMADRDPCATARTLRRMSERITVDVVEILPTYLGQVLPGFAQGSLACIAREGGGRYLQVGEMGQADLAVWSMVEESRSNLVVSALLSEGVPLAGDSTVEGGAWGATLYPSGSLSPIRSSNILPVSWAVPPGDYTLRVWYRDLSGTVNGVRVASERPVEARVNLHAAGLAVHAVDRSGQEVSGDFREGDCATRWELVADDGEVAGGGCVLPASATVRAGSYTVRLVSDRYAAGEARVEVSEGGVAAVTLVEGSTTEAPGATPGD